MLSLKSKRFYLKNHDQKCLAYLEILGAVVVTSIKNFGVFFPRNKFVRLV